PGCLPKGAAGRTIRICDQRISRRKPAHTRCGVDTGSPTRICAQEFERISRRRNWFRRSGYASIKSHRKHPARHDPAIWGSSMPEGPGFGGSPCNLAALSQTGHSPARPVLGEAGTDLYGEPQAVKKMALFRGLTAVLAAGAWG